MTETTRAKFMTSAIAGKILPEKAPRMAELVSLNASNDASKPIQFWQLHSVLGQEPVVRTVADFYQRVFDDEPWFRAVFERVGPLNHHINTQAAMWLDVMGGGPFYHGGDFRLSFHHNHNAMQLMNAEGAERWASLMRDALENCQGYMSPDLRARTSINTFLSFFFDKYASEFGFQSKETFGPTNQPFKARINFLTMTSEAVEALSETEIKDELIARGIDVAALQDKQALVNKALSL